MIVAVKEGGGSTDPNNNSRLATVITKAKAANMPNDNIKRVLERAAGAGSGDNYESITYEGYGPSGVAVIVETMTDSRNRTAGNVRHHFDKYGGNMGASGCVAWNFTRKGVLVIDNEDEELEEDNVMMDALDAGAADFEAEETSSRSTPSPTTSMRLPMPSPRRAMSLNLRRSSRSPELQDAHRRRGHQEHGKAHRHHGGQRRRAERVAQLGSGTAVAFCCRLKNALSFLISIRNPSAVSRAAGLSYI